MTNRERGDKGERTARNYLEQAGWMILAEQYRFEGCEVDLVCFEPHPTYERGGELVFVEVKARRGSAFGTPEEAVNKEKQHRIGVAAEAYLYEHHLQGSRCRFDVVSVSGEGDKTEVKHFRNAFSLGE